jgi:peptidoglycan/xylan/chitin deacetylase (PgdA/CDA1 family)
MSASASFSLLVRAARAIVPTIVAAIGACTTAFGPRAPEPPRVDAPTSIERPRGPSDLLSPGIVSPDVLPRALGPEPHNPAADVDRAGILAEGAEGSGEIALTFDDGPGIENTGEVLRILSAHRAQGTFFLIGSRLTGPGVVAEIHRGLARAIVSEGHVVGNHGLDHAPLDDGLDPAWTTFQIEASATAIARATGVPPRFFRPPYGRIGTFARSVLAARKDELVLWTLDAQDTMESDPAKIAHRLEQQLLFAGQGVVLLHELRSPSVRALSILLDWIDLHPRFHLVGLETYLDHAAAHPYPQPDRLELLRFREQQHRSPQKTAAR